MLIWTSFNRNVLMTIAESRFEQKFVRLLERIHKVHYFEGEASNKIHVVREEPYKDSNDNQTRLCMARSMDENG